MYIQHIYQCCVYLCYILALLTDTANTKHTTEITKDNNNYTKILHDKCLTKASKLQTSSYKDRIEPFKDHVTQPTVVTTNIPPLVSCEPDPDKDQQIAQT